MVGRNGVRIDKRSEVVIFTGVWVGGSGASGEGKVVWWEGVLIRWAVGVINLQSKGYYITVYVT